MADYLYDLDICFDPDNPNNIVRGGLIEIYDANDLEGTTLLALKDTSGLPIPNPMTSNEYGVIGRRIAPVPQCLWKSGPFSGVFNSYKGLRDEAIAAKEAAEAIEAMAAAGEFVGEPGPPGPQGADGANVLPTDEAIEQAILGDSTKTRAALEATITAEIEEALANFNQGERAYFNAAFAPPPPADLPTITVEPYALSVGEALIRETRTSTDGPADLVADPHFRYDGMMVLPANGTQPSSFVSTGLLTGGESQAARYQMRIQTITSPVDRVKIKLRAAATALSFRIKVNGAWVTKTNVRVSGLVAGQAYSVVLDFPTYAARHIEYEESGGDGFGGMAVELGATLTRPAEPSEAVRVAILGDSFSGGAGTPMDGAGRVETWGNYVAKLMGATSLINFGIGGTGYIATANTFGTRTADILAFNPTHVLILGSRNDGASGGATLQDAVADVLADLASVPNVIVSGPSTSAFAGNNNSVKAAALAAGRPFLDGLAEEWITADDIGSDGVHPTFNGHQKIARGFYEAMRALGETPLVYVPTPDVGDHFNRADTAAGLGVSSISGATWAATGGGTAGIDANRGYVYNSTVSVAYRLLSAGATGEWDWVVPVVGANKAPKCIFNYIGGNDHFRVYGNGTNWVLQQRTTGGGTVDTNLGVACANNDHIKVTRDSANLLKVYINGAQVYSATNSNNAAGTSFGIAGSNANNDTRYDDVTHTPLAP
ncbi:SGNH/GDSL hydrolase family protein [Pseudarthrobacter siccitolerans]